MQAPLPARPRRRRSVAAAILLILAGCDPSSLGGGAPARGTVMVGGAPLAIAGPPGFCLDAASTRVDQDGAYVLMGDCGLLGSGGGSRRSLDAVLTASLIPAGGGGAPVLQSIADVGRFAGSAQGRLLIGQGGDGRNVRVLTSRRQDGAVFLLVEDRGRKPVAGIQPRFWRGFVDLGDRLAVVTVLAFEGGGIDVQEGLNLAAGFAGTLRRANGL